jgi:diguanylate cyclase (GGDEF)-like protein
MVEGKVVTSRVRAAVRAWEVWTLPTGLRGFVVATTSLWAAAAGLALTAGVPGPSDLAVFALVMGCGLFALEVTRRQGEPAGVLSKDLNVPWLLAVALLLPPVLAVLAPIPLIVMTQLRVREAPVYRRVFTVASNGLANGLVAVALHQVSGRLHFTELTPGASALSWTGLAIAAALVYHVVNTVVVAVAVRSASPETSWRSLLADEEELLSDAGELCVSVMVALLCLLSPLLAVVSLIPVILLQRAFLHDQLSAAARLDAKTGLLNGPTWEREATSEIARANRTGTALSVMLLDLDHFKEVNDRFGHLAGDEILIGVAEAMKTQTREYDLIGRFGGDEFAIMLPQSDLLEATMTAERIRRRIAAITVPSDEQVVRTSASIGVAELTSPEQGVTDLLAAADVSLYRAKETRNQVHSALHDDLSYPRDL